MMRLSLCCVLAFAGAASAQPPEVKPGPEHAVLAEMAGTWAGKMKMAGAPDESDCRATYRMELGGLWMTGNFSGNLGGQRFQGRSLDSYDAASKKYNGVWVDSMSTKMMILEGSYDPATKTMTQTGMGPGPDGKEVKHKMVTTMTSKDAMTFKMFMGDMEMLTIEYKRTADQPRRGKGKGKGADKADPKPNP
jgi:hypothetical protein